MNSRRYTSTELISMSHNEFRMIDMLLRYSCFNLLGLIPAPRKFVRQYEDVANNDFVLEWE